MIDIYYEKRHYIRGPKRRSREAMKDSPRAHGPRGFCENSTNSEIAAAAHVQFRSELLPAHTPPRSPSLRVSARAKADIIRAQRRAFAFITRFR